MSKEPEKPKAERGTIFLKPNIWAELSDLAAANGREPSEELRACLLEGLRAGQSRLRNALGDRTPPQVSSGYSPEKPPK